ncbi:MAG: DnaD domain protein [Clostridia bacterium]|nr:DnaD domain protein [Clostridia bacterium]
MSFCSFGENYALFDVTPVENMFLQEFMLRAPGNYVKVYLYGLMQCYHPAEAMSLTRMARDMDIAEDEVFQAFQYWERMGLARRVADSPPRYVYKNLKHKLLMPGPGIEGESVYRYKDFNEALHSLFDKKRKLHEQDYRRVYEWIEVLGLAETVAIMLIRYCIDQYGLRFSFEKADALAREWAEQGVRTIEDAEEMTRHSKQMADDLRQVLRRLGQRRAPSMDEQDLYRKWTADWGFALPAILEACKETTKGSPTMAYLNGILKRQHGLGLHGAEEIAGNLQQESELAKPVKEMYEALGRRGIAPTAEDVKLVGEWAGQGIAPEMMVLAAQAAHHNGGNSMESVRRQLEMWREKGVATAEAARAERARHAAARQAGPAPNPVAARPVREVAQHRYAQRQYAPEELDALGFDLYKEARERGSAE